MVFKELVEGIREHYREPERLPDGSVEEQYEFLKKFVEDNYGELWEYFSGGSPPKWMRKLGREKNLRVGVMYLLTFSPDYAFLNMHNISELMNEFGITTLVDEMLPYLYAYDLVATAYWLKDAELDWE